MACLPSTVEIPTSQLTNWILDSGAAYHMTLENSNFTPDSLVETDKYIKLEDGNFSQRNKQNKLK